MKTMRPAPKRINQEQHPDRDKAIVPSSKITRPAVAKIPLERRTTRGVDDARPTEIYRRAVVLFFAFIAITATVLGLLLVHLHDNAREAGLRLATAFALLAEEQSVSKIQAIEQTLELAESRLSTAGPGSWHGALVAFAKDRPWVQGLFLLDANGRVVESTETTDDAGARFQSWFEQNRDRLARGFHIGGLLRDRNRIWAIPASWPIRDAGGELRGIVLALVAPRMFERAWQPDAQSGYEIELARIDGTVLMRAPLDEDELANDSLTAAIHAKLAEGARQGSLEAGSPDGARLVVFRRLEEYPDLVASIGISMDRILREWRDIVQLVVAGWILAVITVILFAFWLVRISVARWAAQRRYRLLFQTNPYAILIVDPGTGRLLAVNDAAAKQYGRSRDELLAMTVADLARDSRAAVISGQFVHRRKDGSLVDVEVTTRPVEFSGKPAVMAIAHDVSERVKIETARQAAEERLRQSQKMEAVGQLTGGVAHDLNNILTVILANIDALRAEEKASLPASVARRLDRVISAALRASDLTRQLLAFSRKQPLRPEVTDLGELVELMIQLLVRSLGEHIQIDVQTAPDLHAVYVDRAQLETALLNLCVNARDAMPRGGRLLIELRDVELDHEYANRFDLAPGGYALIAVSDSGTGIPKEVIPRIFEPFFTTKDVGKGTGLGLSMVYGFIKQSKGHIEVYSEMGYGTTFKIYLPAVARSAQTARARVAEAIVGGRERILVVEDEEQVRETVVEQLLSLGYTVHHAAGGTDGLAIAEQQPAPFDLVLTDVVMPGPYSGRELADAILGKWPATKIVFMSGYTQDAMRNHGGITGGTPLLSKPFSKRELAQTIRQALDKAG